MSSRDSPRAKDLREAIDGNRRDGSEVRGGVQGCAPYGSSSFELGCTVVAGEDRISLDVRIQVEPDVQIVYEELRHRPVRGKSRAYLVTDPPQPGLVDIQGRYFNGKRGINPAVRFRSDRLLTAQAPTKVPGASKAVRDVQHAAATVIDALRAVFILDPVPALMRQYVPQRDTTLRRRAENLSGVIGALRDDPARWEQLRDLVRALPEQKVAEIDVERSQLDNVMLVMRERFEDVDVPFSARVMSDGMLRFLAFAAALLEAPALDEATDAGPHTLLVIEELENGLHPSQAARIVELIKAESERRRIRTFATTHSPAMLTALGADDHDGVLEVLRVPGKTQCHDEIVAELALRVDANEALVLPTAAIIETGNHIAQLPDGASRRTCAERLVRVLRSAAPADAPWVLNDALWNAELVDAICTGARGCPPLPEMASQGVGAGDVSILAEAEAFERRVSNVQVGIWTLDRGLAAYG